MTTKLIAGVLAAASLLGAAAVTVAPTEASARPYYGRHHYRPVYRHYGYRRVYRPYYGRHRYYGRHYYARPHYRHWR